MEHLHRLGSVTAALAVPSLGPFFALQVANLAIMARLEADVDYIAASLAVHLT